MPRKNAIPEKDILEIDDNSFGPKVVDSKLPTLVDFYRPTCVPCKALEPLLGRLAQEYRGRLQVVRINVETSPATSLRFAIQSLPALVMIKDGRPLNQLASRATYDSLRRFVEKAL